MHLHKKFHIPNSNGPLVTAVKVDAKGNLRCCFKIYKNTLKICIFLEDILPHMIPGPQLSGSSFPPT
jgi:hypothetical protein